MFMWTPANLRILGIEIEDKCMKPKRNVVESEVKGSKSGGLGGGDRVNGVGNRSGKKMTKEGNYFQCRGGSTYCSKEGK